MSRSVLHLLPWISLAVVALSPFAGACDALRKDTADAAVVLPAATPAPVVPATPAPVAPGVVPVAPLGGQVAPTPGAAGAKPAAGGGKPAEAGAPPPAADGGAAPTPTPVFTIPTAIPGFDAGGFKPPAGFPSTLPTFPPQPPQPPPK